jgi:hypothetical protein
MTQLARVRTSVLDIAYEHSGTPEAMPVVLLHGYPYDPRAFDGVVPIVTAAGFRAIVPYLRGYGPTRFLSSDTPRSGEQAALGQDLLALLAWLRRSGQNVCTVLCPALATKSKTLPVRAILSILSRSKGFGTSTIFKLSGDGTA